MKRVKILALFLIVPLILTLGLVSSGFTDFIQDVEAEKADGVLTKKFGSKNARIVCGDRLCSQIDESKVGTTPTIPNNMPEPPLVQTQVIPFDDQNLDDRVLALESILRQGEAKTKSQLEQPGSTAAPLKITPREPGKVSTVNWGNLEAMPPHAKAASLIIWNESMEREILKLNDQLQQYIGDGLVTESEMPEVGRIKGELERMMIETQQVLSLANSLENVTAQWEAERGELENNEKRFLRGKQLEQEKQIIDSMHTITRQLHTSILSLTGS